MVDELDMSGKLETVMEVSSTNIVNGDSVKLPEEKVMICTSNCEYNTFDDDVIKATDGKMMLGRANECKNAMEVSPSGEDNVAVSKGNNEDVEVEILDNVDEDEERIDKMEPGDTTEGSSASSFGCSDDTGTSNAVASGDVEVESEVRVSNASLLGFDGFGDLFRTRKKRLTAHWRKFIRPLMWRCKWTELQIGELHSQLCKYDRELSKEEKIKQSQFEKCATEELGVKPIPLNQNRSAKLMKRKKRRRDEETIDIASYMSCHNLFSYYASKRLKTDSVYMDEDHCNTDVVSADNTPFGNDEFGTNVDWASFEFKDSNAYESILQKIEETQLKVHQLKIRMDEVVREHGNSDDLRLAPNDQLVSCAPCSVLPCVNTEKVPSGPVCTTHQQMSEKKLAMAESACRSCRDVTTFPDTVDSQQLQSGGKCEKIEHGTVLLDQSVKGGLHNAEKVGNQQIAESHVATKRKKIGNGKHVANPNSTIKAHENREQSALKIQSFSKSLTPKNKRKRGRRKAQSSKWSRRSSG